MGRTPLFEWKMMSSEPSAVSALDGCPVNSLLTPIGYEPSMSYLSRGYFRPVRVTPYAGPLTAKMDMYPFASGRNSSRPFRSTVRVSPVPTR